MVKFDHHVGSLGLRFLFHTAAGSRFGTGPPRHRSAHGFGFVSRIIVSSRLFCASASPRPLSGVPTPGAGVQPWRQAAYWKAMHRRALEREAQLQAEIQRLEALVRLREQQLFGRKTETSAATAPAASDASHADSPPRQPRGQQRGRPSPSAAIIPTSLTLSKKRSCRPTSAAARSVVSLSPISRAPRIPPSWRSMSGPIAESFAVAVIDRPARVVLIPASSPPRHRTG